MKPVLMDPPPPVVPNRKHFQITESYCTELDRLTVMKQRGRWFHVDEFVCGNMAYHCVRKWKRHKFKCCTRKEVAPDGFFIINVYAKWEPIE